MDSTTRIRDLDRRLREAQDQIAQLEINLETLERKHDTVLEQRNARDRELASGRTELAQTQQQRQALEQALKQLQDESSKQNQQIALFEARQGDLLEQVRTRDGVVNEWKLRYDELNHKLSKLEQEREQLRGELQARLHAQPPPLDAPPPQDAQLTLGGSRRVLLGVLIALLLVAGFGGCVGGAIGAGASSGPTPTIVVTDTPTSTSTPSPSPTRTSSPSPTRTPSPSPTRTPSPSPTSSPSPTKVVNEPIRQRGRVIEINIGVFPNTNRTAGTQFTTLPTDTQVLICEEEDSTEANRSVRVVLAEALGSNTNPPLAVNKCDAEVGPSGSGWVNREFLEISQ
jgi:cell division septation protein DedD